MARPKSLNPTLESIVKNGEVVALPFAVMVRVDDHLVKAAALAYSLAVRSEGSFTLSTHDVQSALPMTKSAAHRALQGLERAGLIERLAGGHGRVIAWRWIGSISRGSRGVLSVPPHGTLSESRGTTEGVAKTDNLSCLDSSRGVSGGVFSVPRDGTLTRGYIDNHRSVPQHGTLKTPQALAALRGWGVDPDVAKAVAAEYPSEWIAAKVADCEGYREQVTDPRAYLLAALARWRLPKEREAFAERRRADAERARRDRDRERAGEIKARAERLQRIHRERVARMARAWWAELSDDKRATVAAAFHAENPVAAEMGREGFDPDRQPWAAAAVEAAWWASKAPSTAWSTVGVDMQQDDRMYWLRLGFHASGVVLEGWGCAYGYSDVQASGAAAGLVDEGDGQTTGNARRTMEELAAADGVWRTWKGGGDSRAVEHELRPMKSYSGGVWGNESTWAGEALALVADPNRLAVSPEFLTTEAAALWHGLASRLELDRSMRGPDDHLFDAFKMALAAAELGDFHEAETQGTEAASCNN